MSVKCSAFIATSLDGFISREDGSIDWLMKANTLAPPGEDCGYKSFISTVDGLVMGRHSYEKVLSFDEWPYGDLPVVVMSSQTITIPEQLRTCISTSAETPIALVQRLSKQGYKHLYIDGGVTIQRFLANNLVNEMTITLIPVLLGSGRSLFGSLKNDIELHHVGTRTFDGGFVQMKYRIGTLKEV
jgi:dihydrofolate reductase